MGYTILLYDGLCGLCDRLVQFTLRHDRKDGFRFAALQSEFASEILQRHRQDSGGLSTVVLVRDLQLPTECLSFRSDAVLDLLSELGPLWRCAAALGRFCPTPIRDWVYDTIARHRYRAFGRYASCPLPSEAQREKFLGN